MWQLIYMENWNIVFIQVKFNKEPRLSILGILEDVTKYQYTGQENLIYDAC